MRIFLTGGAGYIGSAAAQMLLEAGHAVTVYNLGNGSGYSVQEVIETARRVTGHPIPAVQAPRRPGDAPRLVASAEKIRRELGWSPRHPELEGIVASAWSWHRSRPHGYEKVD